MDKNYIIDRRAYAERRLNETRRDSTRLDSKDDERREPSDRRDEDELEDTMVFENEEDLHNYIQKLPDIEQKDFLASIDDHGRLYKIIEKSV